MTDEKAKCFSILNLFNRFIIYVIIIILSAGDRTRGLMHTLNKLYHSYFLEAFDIHAMHDPHSTSVSPIGCLPSWLSPRW